MKNAKRWKKQADHYLYVDDFIHSYLQSVARLQQSEPYICFALICMGIEFLGKCLDEHHDFLDTEDVMTSKQFYKVINLYFKPYKELNLYASLRCPMLHGLLPGSTILLKDRDGTTHAHLSHQEMFGKRATVIIIQDFYSHFEYACGAVIKRIHRNGFRHPKMRSPFLVIRENETI